MTSIEQASWAWPPSPTYTTKSDRRRSLVDIASALKPSKTNFKKYWPRSRHSTSYQEDVPDWDATSINGIVHLAGLQMGALGHPGVRLSRDRDDPILKAQLEQRIPKSVTNQATCLKAAPKPPLGPPTYTPPSIPMPNRAPPPPPIPELSAVNYDHDEDTTHYSDEWETPYVRPLSTFRRRPKTPVRRIGQLEGPRIGNMDGIKRMPSVSINRIPSHSASIINRMPSANINRMSSVSTITREYRALVTNPEDPPPFPSIDAKYGMMGDYLDADAAYLHSQRPPSLTSDNGTLLDSEPDAVYPTLLVTSAPSTPPSECQEESEEKILDDGSLSVPTAALRFQIGLELLTRELSSAFAEQSSRDNRSSSDLQIWVMIEAYERLRDQLAASPSDENEEARHAIDSWLHALYAIHGNMAGGAGDVSESEYGDDDDDDDIDER